jgi:ribosomal 50S subunit-recycling heat shock protein
MRIDRFLKLSRLVKRRATAQEMIEVGAIHLNGKSVKPAVTVKSGDTIEIAFPRRVITVTVITANEPEMKRGAQSTSVVGEKRLADDEKPW